MSISIYDAGACFPVALLFLLDLPLRLLHCQVLLHHSLGRLLLHALLTDAQSLPIHRTYFLNPILSQVRNLTYVYNGNIWYLLILWVNIVVFFGDWICNEGAHMGTRQSWSREEAKTMSAMSEFLPFIALHVSTLTKVASITFPTNLRSRWNCWDKRYSTTFCSS